MTRILFVCLGNICRSPLVEAVARGEFARAGLAIDVTSAGTGGHTAGEPADARALAVARRHGYALSAHRARQVKAADFDAFDHILAMDRANLRALQALRGAGTGAVPALFLDPREVPDPYYGSGADFETVVALARRGAAAWIERLAPLAAGA